MRRGGGFILTDRRTDRHNAVLVTGTECRMTENTHPIVIDDCVQSVAEVEQQQPLLADVGRPLSRLGVDQLIQ